MPTTRKIKKGDKVLMAKGKDRGKSGKVLKVIPLAGKVVVEGLNLYKQTVRAKRQGEQSQIVDRPMPVRVENVRLFCSSCNKVTRAGYIDRNGKKERYCKKCKAKL